MLKSQTQRRNEEMWRKTVIVFLAAVMLVPLSACQPAAPEEAAEERALPSPEEVVNAAVKALEAVKTFEFEADMTMNITGEAEGEAIDVSMETQMTGMVDVDSEEMKMDMDVAMTVPDEGELEAGMEMYFIGDTMYMLMQVPELGNISMWMKSELPPGMYQQMTQVQDQVDLLAASEIEIIGTENVGGTDCYVLELRPDPEELWELAMQQSQVTSQELPEVEEDFMKEVFEGFSVKQWIARDTYLLCKAEIEMALEITPEAMGFPDEEGSLTMEIVISLLAYDYNQPVSIELPPEAENAIEVDADELPW
jgi:outer membrane lipoprotein-sorting protein